MTKEERAEYARKWYWKNHKKVREIAHKSYVKNKSKVAERSKNYLTNNRDKVNSWRRLHRRTSPDYSKTNVAKGDNAEKHALTILKGSTWVAQKNKKEHYDLLWNGLKVDVKSSNLYKDGAWHFTTTHGFKNDKDYYFCIGYVLGKPYRYYLIPKDIFPFNCSIYKDYSKSKYRKFIYML